MKELLSNRMRLTNEDKDEPQNVLSSLEKAISNSELTDQFPRIRVDYQKAYNEILSFNRAMERKNLPAFEQSIETINHKCNLLEPLFKPLIDLSSFYSEDFATALRNVFSSITNNNDEWHQYATAGASALDGKTSIFSSKEDHASGGRRRLVIINFCLFFRISWEV